MKEEETEFFRSSLDISQAGVFKLLVAFGIDPEEIKSVAIKILDNPNSTKKDRESALNFARQYKILVRDSCIHTPEISEQKAICVDNHGRRVDLKTR
jgi:hypothetical protein